MARIDESLDRVDAALTRLEGNLDKVPPAAVGGASVARIDALALRVDRALATARAAKAALDLPDSGSA